MTHGAFAAVINDGKVLLVKPPEWVSEFSEHWNFPGGVVEEGEELERGAEREVWEETGIKCIVKKLIDTAHNQKFETFIHIYEAIYISGTIHTQPEEIIDARWFSFKDALELPLAFDIKNTLTKYFNQQ